MLFGKRFFLFILLMKRRFDANTFFSLNSLSLRRIVQLLTFNFIDSRMFRDNNFGFCFTIRTILVSSQKIVARFRPFPEQFVTIPCVLYFFPNVLHCFNRDWVFISNYPKRITILSVANYEISDIKKNLLPWHCSCSLQLLWFTKHINSKRRYNVNKQ